ncbi:HpcH/HpaI aldolase/citrate lyase family protein [Amycolatopsis sp. NPDC088138]|uniref:HpcH/HpaI aldolase/citrate lyase family protein n=1 Tax=Amycolatopsis sp. NPDC088138 TaxID=3363938 RepID=UPI0038169936
MIAAARSFLFVPGHRPDRFAKAAASGADVVVLDLEDAVGADRKDEAREHVRSWLAEGHEAVVRVNAAGEPWHDEDVAAVGGLATAIMLPKAEDPGPVAALGDVIPLLETAAGIERASAICRAPSVIRPAFGSVDLAAQLGVDHRSHEALLHARSAVVLAAAASGCAAPIDGVTTAIDDEAVLRADLAHAVTLGFTAKLCVHPRQIAVVNAGLTPSAEDVEWARRVVAAGADGSVAVHNGQMIDRPVLLRARALLARAGES